MKTSQLRSGNIPYAQGGIVYKGLNDSPEKLTPEIISLRNGVQIAKVLV